MNTSTKKHNFKLNLLQRFFTRRAQVVAVALALSCAVCGLFDGNDRLTTNGLAGLGLVLLLVYTAKISDEQYQAIIDKAETSTVVTQTYTLSNNATYRATDSGRHAYEITKSDTALSSLTLDKLVKSADTITIVPNASAWRVQMQVSDFTDKRTSQLVRDYCLSVNNKIDEARLLLADEEIVRPVERAVALRAQADKPKLSVNPTKELVYEVMATDEQIESYMSTHLTFDITDFVKYVNA